MTTRFFHEEDAFCDESLFRSEKGKQISGANAFRIEALLNLLDIPIISIYPASVTKYIKKEGNAILGKNEAYAYQNGALDTLYYGIRKK